METIKRFTVPTGDILVVAGEKGPLELLSIGDYGRDVNLNQGKPVPDGLPIVPLTEKWVITISTQYGCSTGCLFCDVPKVGPGRNATQLDLQQQVLTGIQLHPEIRTTKRLNVHYARMGEPSWNPEVLDNAKWLKVHIDPEYRVHPVVSTMLPRKNPWLKTFIHNWMRLKNRVYQGEAGLQLSINSTDEDERSTMFNDNALTLLEASKLFDGIVPMGRKIILNFAIAEWTIDPQVLRRFFDPGRFVIKLTPMHKTAAATYHQIETEGDYTQAYPYQKHADALRKAGYDVLVFIASEDEDLSGITCGNAVLSGVVPERAKELVS